MCGLAAVAPFYTAVSGHTATVSVLAMQKHAKQILHWTLNKISSTALPSLNKTTADADTGKKALSYVTCVRACVVWVSFTCNSLLVHTHVCRVCELNQSPSRFIITLTTLRAGPRDMPNGKVKIRITFTILLLTVTGEQWLGFLYKHQTWECCMTTCFTVWKTKYLHLGRFWSSISDVISGVTSAKQSAFINIVY